ncbi:hypothetical protein ACJMK2_020306, partial [Sinanodonta woodiana]
MRWENLVSWQAVDTGEKCSHREDLVNQVDAIICPFFSQQEDIQKSNLIPVQVFIVFNLFWALIVLTGVVHNTKE